MLGQQMTATPSNPPAHAPTLGTLRLQLKPAHRWCGFVQGAWWPHSTKLDVELPALLKALALRFGPIDRVGYCRKGWLPTPSSMEYEDGQVILDTSRDSPNVITVFGQQVGRLALLVVPPDSSPDDAYAVMAKAASVSDASAPDELLKAGKHSVVALQRWESEGGALR